MTRSLSRASILALASNITLSPAFAQNTPPATTPVAKVEQSPPATVAADQALNEQSDEQTPRSGSPAGDIVGTGSRIRRAGFDTPQPALVIDSAQIANRGYTNVADALAELPAFGVPGSTRAGTQAGSFGAGQNFFNFFGLGSQRTLTLINSRQFVSSNTASIFRIFQRRFLRVPRDHFQCRLEHPDAVSGGGIIGQSWRQLPVY